MPRTLRNSILAPILPNRHGMSAVPDPDDSAHRGSRFARWAAQHNGTPPPAAWLFGEPNDQARELEELRERLAEAERRAEEAEAALPHLLALGQRTVNGLLNDARARGRQIIEEARAQAEVEAAEARKALEREASELDALRMAVACEAMGLESVRNELEARVKELGLGEGDLRDLLARGLPAAAPVEEADHAATSDPHRAAGNPASALDEVAGPILPPPPPPADLIGMGLTPGAAHADAPSSRFADAWARGEDEMMAEAFDRFFAAHIESDPLRDAVIDPSADAPDVDDRDETAESDRDEVVGFDHDETVESDRDEVVGFDHDEVAEPDEAWVHHTAFRRR